MTKNGEGVQYKKLTGSQPCLLSFFKLQFPDFRVFKSNGACHIFQKFLSAS